MGRRYKNELGENIFEDDWDPTPQEIATECEKIKAANLEELRKAPGTPNKLRPAHRERPRRKKAK